MTLWFVRRGWQMFVADDSGDITVDSWVRPLTINEQAQYRSGASPTSDYPDVVLTRHQLQASFKNRQPELSRMRDQGKAGRGYSAKIGRVFDHTIDFDIGTITREEYHAR